MQALVFCLYFTLPCTQGPFFENLVAESQAFFVVDDVSGHLHIMADQLVWHHHELLSWARAHNICAMLMHILPLVEMYCKWKSRDNGGNLQVLNKVFFFLVLRVDFKACLDILFLIHMRTHSWDKRDVSCNWWGLWTHLQIHVNITSTVNNGSLHTHSL